MLRNQLERSAAVPGSHAHEVYLEGELEDEVHKNHEDEEGNAHARRLAPAARVQGLVGVGKRSLSFFCARAGASS